jgi:D-alanine-D-alanine ligase
MGKRQNKLLIPIIYTPWIEPNAGESPDRNGEFDSIEVIQKIAAALEPEYNTLILETRAETLFAELMELQDKYPKKVVPFDLSEDVYRQNIPSRRGNREALVTAMLDILQLPYIGSGQQAQMISTNKWICNQFLLAHKIPVAHSYLAKEISEAYQNPKMGFPRIVKPIHEGTSIGISNMRSVVNNPQELEAQVESVIETYRQPAIVQEFCPGDEYTVGLWNRGDEKHRLPLARLNFSYLPSGMAPIDGREAKMEVDDPTNGRDMLICPVTDIDQELEERIRQPAEKAYHALHMKDLGRIDVRRKNGAFCVLDVQTKPGIDPDPKHNARYVRIWAASGVDYNEMLKTIIEYGIERLAKAGRLTIS